VAAYNPPPLDPAVLQADAAVLAGTAAVVAYWWFVLVPGARVRLAVNKKTGTLRRYLEELQADDSRPLQKWCAAFGQPCWLRLLPAACFFPGQHRSACDN
jgi:hypothetical protein